MKVWELNPEAAGYPAGLVDLDPGERPAPLYCAGRPEAIATLDQPAVTIVGSRQASGYGLRVAERLAHDLAVAGVTVVSGLARGIDAAAHRGALAGGGVTIAVLANGPDVVYPRSNRHLYERILASGALVSERPPGVVARPGWFVARNRIMAALANVVVIVEAAQPSGTLVTADRALRLGRTVGAIPGQVGVRVAEGTNDLLKDGAAFVRDARDVLDLLFGVGASASQPDRAPVRRPGPALDKRLEAVLGLVGAGAATVERVSLDGDLAPSDAARALTRLELLGYIDCDALGAYRRTDLAAP
ncbi:MAG: DNA-processing protein DprA [Solirubrobacterales bacterium]